MTNRRLALCNELRTLSAGLVMYAPNCCRPAKTLCKVMGCLGCAAGRAFGGRDCFALGAVAGRLELPAAKGLTAFNSRLKMLSFLTEAVDREPEAVLAPGPAPDPEPDADWLFSDVWLPEGVLRQLHFSPVFSSRPQ